MNLPAYPRMIAHRGGGVAAPENTLAAHRVGRDHGFRMVEFDAKLSGDGVVVLIHDDTVDRTTDGSGRVAGLTYGELARLDAGGWHSPPFAGEPIPTLAAIAKFCRANDVAANVEIKPCPGRDEETGGAVALEASRGWDGAATPPLLSSFSTRALTAAQAAAPLLPRGHLFEAVPPDWPARMQQVDAQVLVARHDALDADLVRRIKGAGYAVAAYTVNDEARVRALFALGLASVITDSVGELSPLL